MSDNNQDTTTTQFELAATPKAPCVSQRAFASESTPATQKYGSDLPYICAPKSFEKARHHLTKEIDVRWLGVMPIDTFLNKYVPATEEPLPDLPSNLFENVPRANDGTESGRYDPFITAILESWMPHLQAVNTSAKGDTVNKVYLKTDISVYNRVDGVPPPDRTDFSRMELWMEFKAKKDGAAFGDPRVDTEKERLLAIETESFMPDTDEGRKARGQLAHYAGAQHSQQFRHFSFSIVIQEDHARFLRWDPSATVVTAEVTHNVYLIHEH